MVIVIAILLYSYWPSCYHQEAISIESLFFSLKENGHNYRIGAGEAVCE